MMRGWLGLAGLLVALVIVGTLVRKQMTAVRAAVPPLETPANAPANASLAPGHIAQQNLPIQQQLKQAVVGAMQTRAMPDDK